MVGGLPKESTEERYWDSMDGDELPRDPLSGSPGNPWYISPEGSKYKLTPTSTKENAKSSALKGSQWRDYPGGGELAYVVIMLTG